MADRSNYADKPTESSGLAEHRLRFGDENRAYTPTSGEADNVGHFGGLADGATGDWAWKPQRYRADKGWIWSAEMIAATYPDGYVPNVRIVEPAWRTAELEAQMPTFRGVPPSAAESYRGQVFARS